MSSRKTSDFMARIEAAAAVRAAQPKADSTGPSDALKEVGFVGKALAASNRSIEAQRDDAMAERDRAIAELQRLQAVHGSNLLELDPREVAPSPFAIRIKQAFQDPAFTSLCDDIKRIGGNLAPVLVRAYSGPEQGTFAYELIAGHRRRAACELLGIPVVAILKEVDDHEAIRMMASENENREQESRYELGLHYQHLLTLGKAKSANEVALLVGRPRTGVQRCLKAALLPETIVALFVDPREIRLEWLDPLLDAWQNKKDQIEERITHVRDSKRPLSSLATFKLLTQSEAPPRVKPETIRINDHAALKITTSPTGRVGFNFTETAPKDVIEKVMQVVREWQKGMQSEDGND